MTAAATEIAALDATAQAALVRSGQVSATELVDGAIDRIERLNPQLNAVVTPLFEQARAAVADATPTGPFAGVPFLLKDLVVEIEGTPLREGSMFLRDHVSTFTSELVTRLRRWRCCSRSDSDQQIALRESQRQHWADVCY
jgi:amidase